MNSVINLQGKNPKREREKEKARHKLFMSNDMQIVSTVHQAIFIVIVNHVMNNVMILDISPCMYFAFLTSFNKLKEKQGREKEE